MVSHFGELAVHDQSRLGLHIWCSSLIVYGSRTIILHIVQLDHHKHMNADDVIAVWSIHMSTYVQAI